MHSPLSEITLSPISLQILYDEVDFLQPFITQQNSALSKPTKPYVLVKVNFVSDYDDAKKQLLHNILQACKLETNAVSIQNILDDHVFDPINSNYTTVIEFSDSQNEKSRLENLSNIQYIYAPLLSSIHANKNAKQHLWQILKQVFKV